MTSPFYTPALRTASAIALACATLILTACGKKEQAAPPPQIPEVQVYKVVVAPLKMSTELPGRTNAFQVADVRPQVSGLIQKRLFTEGADVKAGTALYQIDPATYQASVNSAKAALVRAQASLLSSGPAARRNKELLDIEGVSRADYENSVAADAQAKADVETARAALATAQINLQYTHVYAPISGRIGRSTVTPGALVTAAQETALTTVQQLDPIYVDVTQSSDALLKLKRDLDSGDLTSAGKQANVTLMLSDGTAYGATGKLQFADVSVDTSTGNVTLRALFPNPKQNLLPGMFVRAVVESGVKNDAMLVPQVGVSRNAKGEATAMVLGKDGKVAQKILTTGGTYGDKWLVTSGLVADDLVIVEGLQKIKPGSPARIAPAAAKSAP
ncbi:efflux RND transporter periplasmic adaptor subunit [Massilia sp. S19_KUP03_FR1]|uniref:efflux RND transporter periplasmic adaptor subunit n=1 Tax=Massilia sp. S19_KUP03_FR1 TaxID=3025503 RepID=UPI002FCD7C4C